MKEGERVGGASPDCSRKMSERREKGGGQSGDEETVKDLEEGRETETESWEEKEKGRGGSICLLQSLSLIK